MTTNGGQRLFEVHANIAQKGHAERENDHTHRVAVAAHQLAVQFTQDEDLPAHYRKVSSRTLQRTTKKMKKDSELAKHFATTVVSWTRLIETMLTKIDSRQAWRFISLSPEVHLPLTKLTDCKDLCDFMDYFALRRDTEKCDDDELGGLAQLLTAFQADVSKQVQHL